jgi:hypothetical protein
MLKIMIKPVVMWKLEGFPKVVIRSFKRQGQKGKWKRTWKLGRLELIMGS